MALARSRSLTLPRFAPPQFPGEHRQKVRGSDALGVVRVILHGCVKTLSTNSLPPGLLFIKSFNFRPKIKHIVVSAGACPLNLAGGTENRLQSLSFSSQLEGAFEGSETAAKTLAVEFAALPDTVWKRHPIDKGLSRCSIPESTWKWPLRDEGKLRMGLP